MKIKYLVKKEIKLKINALSTKCVKFKTSNNKLHSNCNKDSLEKKHQKFIVTRVDKANGDVAEICKIFYALTLIKELGLTLLAPIPQNGQTHSNNSSAICRRIV